MEYGNEFDGLLTESYGILMYDSVSEYRERNRFLNDHRTRNPQNYHALNNRATAHAEIGQMTAAAKDFAAAIRCCGTDPIPLMNRGRFRVYSEDYDGAIEDFSRALELSPMDVTTWRARAYAHWDHGDLSTAQQDFLRAVEMEPGVEGTRQDLAEVTAESRAVQSA